MEGDLKVPIVAIGASAGGLEPFEQFFDAMSPDTGIAFVVIQHLSPDFESMMDELLSRHSTMDIKRVTQDLALRSLKMPAASSLHNRPLRLNLMACRVQLSIVGIMMRLRHQQKCRHLLNRLSAARHWRMQNAKMLQTTLRAMPFVYYVINMGQTSDIIKKPHSYVALKDVLSFPAKI